jgi:hypothetical protein
LCFVYIMIIINLSKPSQVLTARYLSITALNTIKVAYDHTCIVYTACTATGSGEGRRSRQCWGLTKWLHSLWVSRTVLECI